MMRKGIGEKLFDGTNQIILVLISISMLYPFIYVLAVSLNNAVDTARGGIFLLPRQFTFDSYRIIFENHELFGSAVMSVSRTAIGTVTTVLCSAMFAYVFTKPEYFIYKPMKFIFFFAMFLGGGGLIPTYLLYRNLGILNTFWVYILPVMINMWFVILFRTYYIQLPRGLEEAALIDGAHELSIFFRIMLPLSAPIIATIALFAAVGQWNAWMDTLFFTWDRDLRTLQFVMMEIMQRAEAGAMISRAAIRTGAIGHAQSIDPLSVRMAITIVTTVPIVLVYPFLQKYFIKGMVIGSMKG